jgi:hypothetical protein
MKPPGRFICVGLLAAWILSCAATPEAPAGDGILHISGIPERFTGGVILTEGRNGEGAVFRYSSRVLQRITGTAMTVRLYAEVQAVQTPFTGNGEYRITISLHAPDNPNDSETRYFRKEFVRGSAAIRWEEGIVPRE